MTQSFEESFTPEETSHFKSLYVRVAALVHASEQFLAKALDPAVPGSPNQAARSRKTWDAYEQVGPLLYSAEDHLRTILIVLEAPQIPTYALYTLGRGAAIPIVRCAYLLDPGLTEPQRMARGLNVRLESLIEQNKFIRDDAKYAERVGTLERRALKSGIHVYKSTGTPATDFGERRKSEVALFREYVTGVDTGANKDEPSFGESIYRYLSAHVHALVWVKLSGAETRKTDEPGMSTVKFDLNFSRLAGILSALLRTHEHNILSLLSLSGYPLIVWHDAMRSATEAARRQYMDLAARRKA